MFWKDIFSIWLCLSFKKTSRRKLFFIIKSNLSRNIFLDNETGKGFCYFILET